MQHGIAEVRRHAEEPLHGVAEGMERLLDCPMVPVHHLLHSVDAGDHRDELGIYVGQRLSRQRNVPRGVAETAESVVLSGTGTGIGLVGSAMCAINAGPLAFK